MTDHFRRFKTSRSECSLQCGSESDCKDCQEFGGINKEIQSAEDLARQAKTRRSAFLARVNSRRDLLTSKLPVEVICYIFEEYVQLHKIPPNPYTDPGDEVRPCFFALIHRGGPLRLGAVCRQWRTIAWAHSRLWKTLVISVCSPGHDLGPTMVYEWLSRAGQQQLEIQMNHYEFSFGTKPSIHPRVVKNAMLVVQALNTVSSRWRSLDFSGCLLDILSALDDTGCAAKSVLQHLCLGYHSQRRRSHEATLFKKSMHRHRPTHLSILCPIRPSRLNIEWSQLTHVYLENMSCQHCLRTLARMVKSSPILCHLTLRLTDNLLSMDLSENTYDLRHPALESLIIYEENCDEDTTRLLFSAFTLPALRTLKYIGDDEEKEFPTEDFLEFLKRSACSLETLELVTPCIRDNELARLLRAVPTVCTLKIELTENNHSAFLFENLGQKYVDQLPAPFLPDLTRLDITAEAPQHWMTFIGMFADNPSVYEPEFGQRRPVRHALQVTFKIQSGATRREVDLRSLWQLAFLWNEYQFFVVLQFEEQCGSEGSNASVLMWSYRNRNMVHPGSPRRFEGLEEDLAVMSTLSF